MLEGSRRVAGVVVAGGEVVEAPLGTAGAGGEGVDATPGAVTTPGAPVLIAAHVELVSNEKR